VRVKTFKRKKKKKEEQNKEDRAGMEQEMKEGKDNEGKRG
jgi:hypothetical protein